MYIDDKQTHTNNRNVLMVMQMGPDALSQIECEHNSAAIAILPERWSGISSSTAVARERTNKL